MTRTSLSVLTERVHELNYEFQLLYQRSLVDLALSNRHPYWDVETLEEAIAEKGFPLVIRELQQTEQSFSTRVLIKVLHETALKVRDWSELTVQHRFLTLWREQCQDCGWDEMARQTEGLLFDYRLSSLQRKVTLEVYPKPRLDAVRIGLMATANGQWLLDVGREGIRSWDSNTGQEGPFWSVDVPIDLVEIDSDAQVLISTRDGRLFRWDVLFQVHQEMAQLPSRIEAMTNRAGRIVGWSNHRIYIWDETGDLKVEVEAKFRSTPVVAISEDGNRVIACDGSTLGVWSTVTGGVVFGLGYHSGLTVADVNRVDSILDLGRTELGLRLMDKLDLWGLRLARQYETIQGLSLPLVMSADDKWVVMGEGDQIAWLEWDSGLEEYVVVSEMTVDAVWSFQQVSSIAPNARAMLAIGTNGLVALDFQRQREARYPLDVPLASKVCVLPDSGLIACDDTQKISFFLFRAD